MYQKRTKLWSFTLALVMIAVFIPVNSVSAYGEFTENAVLESPEDGICANFSEFTSTGNPVDDIVACAVAQNGRTGSSLGYSYAWCAAFVSDCAYTVGQSQAIPWNANCDNLRSAIINAGGYYVSTPQKGDIVFWGGNHVALMIDSESCIHGNIDGKVYICRYTNNVGHGLPTHYVRPNYTRSSFWLDVNGYLDNANADSLGSYGTFDVYINGSRVANDVNDYYSKHPVGTSYEIKDIKPKDGKSYNGVVNGARTGSINSDINLRLQFTTIPDNTGVEPVIKTYNGHTYYFVNRQSTWWAAKQFSQKMGGHLVTISDANENTFVNELGGKQGIWIGATDAASEGNWKWVTGESFSYHPWDSGEPNNNNDGNEGSENYASLLKSGKWNDAPGCTLKPFVVEFDEAYTVKYVLNNSYASGAPAAQTKAYGQALTLSKKEPTFPCHTFLGWTKTKGGTTVHYRPGDTYDKNANMTLYPVWAEGGSSDWSTTKPSGVPDSQIEKKTQYRYSEKEEKVSNTPNLPGYTLVSTKRKKVGSGTIDYATGWPSGFDTSHGLYAQYNKSIKTAGDLMDVSTSQIGYIYWHWCNGYEYGPLNRTIEEFWTSYWYCFHAFFSTSDAPQNDGSVYLDGVWYVYNPDVCKDSYWWFRLPVYRQTYTEYKYEYTYERWGNWSAWSDTAYTASDKRKVEKRTLYRVLNGGSNPHAYEASVTTVPTASETGVLNAICSKCGTTATATLPIRNHTDYSITSNTTDGTLCYIWKDTSYGTVSFTAPLKRPFTDVSTSSTFFHPVLWAMENKVTSGRDAMHFAPQETVMRSEAMMFLWAAKGKPAYSTKKSPFKDVKKKDWFYGAVLWAVENKITSGTDSTHFSPSQTCGRSEILQFLYATMGKPGYTIKNPYSDVKKKHWYYDGAIWAYENGLEKGESGKFNAKTPCTRAYVVTYLYRFITGEELAE